MRKETRSEPTICVFCKKPITEEQRPSIALKAGGEAHVYCWEKHEKEQDAGKPN